MKSKWIIVLLLSLILAFSFSSCENNATSGYGSFTAVVGQNQARTIRPAESDQTIAKYYISGSSGDNSVSMTEIPNDTKSITLNNLPTGAWTFTVDGYNSAGTRIATRTESVVINPSSNVSREFVLGWLQTGSGSVHFTVSVPLKSNARKVVVTGNDVVSGEVSTYTLSSNEEERVFTFEMDDVPSGTYEMEISMYNGAIQVGYTLREYALVYDGLESTGNIAWDPEYFYVEAPLITPSVGRYDAGTEITMSAGAGASIYYTMDGSAPTESSLLYDGDNKPVIGSDCTVKAIAYVPRLGYSETTSVSYTVSASQGINVTDPEINTLTLLKNFDELPANRVGVINALFSNRSDASVYKWYVDGVEIKSGNSSILTIGSTRDAELDKGIHLVNVTVTDGTVSLSETMNVLVVDELVINYSIGDRGPANGWIFYDVDADNESGNADGLESSTCGWRYLEAAPSDQSDVLGGFVFGQYRLKASGDNLFANGTTVYDESSCTSSQLGSGRANTQLLIEKMGDGAYYNAPDSTNYNAKDANYAAKVCNVYIVEYEGVIYDDWFLPSKEELVLMYSNLHANGYGDFIVAGSCPDAYWSSSERDGYTDVDGASYAYIYNFRNGCLDNGNRGIEMGVRAVRAFL